MPVYSVLPRGFGDMPGIYKLLTPGGPKRPPGVNFIKVLIESKHAVLCAVKTYYLLSLYSQLKRPMGRALPFK